MATTSRQVGQTLGVALVGAAAVVLGLALASTTPRRLPLHERRGPRDAAPDPRRPLVKSCGCDDFFGSGFARRVAKRYRKRGLDRTATRMVAFLEQAGIEDARVLEIGGGVGEIQLELLKRGAASAVNLELSPAYDREARALLSEAGIDPSRVQRRMHDIAAAPEEVEPADVVVLHRVVCCYPDYERLLTAAASRAGRLLVFSHPPRNLVSRAVVALQNAGLRMRRSEFRTFAHPPAAMLDVCRAHGLTPGYAHAGRVWQVEGLSRGAGR
jgi:protein-L-isoaspartate O-methyltransferase